MVDKQNQKAGDNSQQIQASTVIINNNGIDEERARIIVDEKLNEVTNAYSQEAKKIAEERIQLFADDLILRLVKTNHLNGLKDPSIQILLVEAQKTAASTERSDDYNLLSELLIHRIEKGSDRNVRAGVNRAIEIVDEISDEALLGLTVSHSVFRFSPLRGNIKEGIKALAGLFDKLIYNELPLGGLWLENLDIIDAIRISEIGEMIKLDQIYINNLAGYVDVGIDKKSENYQMALNLLKKSEMPEDILCDHELRPGYSRLRIVSLNQLDSITITYTQQVINNDKTEVYKKQLPLSSEQKLAIKRIYDLYNQDTKLKNDNVTAFFNLWDEHMSLKKLRIWWKTIPMAFSLSSVGKVLAHANAQRCDETIPPLD